MKKEINYFNIFMTAMVFVIAGLLLATGIIALQKSMNMKVGVNITPSHEIRIDYGGETIFCNTTKDSAGIKVASGYTLSGNILTFTQEFISIGETFALTIYNYNTSYLQVLVSGTGASGNTITIDPYIDSVSSGVLNLTIGAGAIGAVLEFNLIETCLISITGTNYEGKNYVVKGNSYNTTFSVTQYYTMPDTITITMEGETLTSGYTYTKTSATTATLTIDSVNGDVVITCNAVAVVVTINVYLDNALNTTVTGEVVYPNTSVVINNINKKPTSSGGAGIGESIELIRSGFGTAVFPLNSGSGTGYTWTCEKYNHSTLQNNRLRVNINVTLGIVANAITIDIYGTTSS